MPARAHRIEVEWQLATRDVERIRRWLGAWSPPRGWQVELDGVQTLHDAYWDTPEWTLYRAGLALRLRRDRAGVEATLKTLRRARGGAARRREIIERLPDARLASLRVGRGAVGRHVRALVDPGALRRLFGLHTRRRTFHLLHEGRAVAELALDRTLVAARRPRRLERVEIELGAGPVALVAAFVATLRRARHLKGVRHSKFEEGLAAAGLVPPRRR